MYDKNFVDDLWNDSWSNAYQKGLEDAWDAARKIALAPESGGYSISELRSAFGEDEWSHALRDLPVDEVVEKVYTYEKQKKQDDKIKVGDEVVNVHNPLQKIIVIRVLFGGDKFVGIGVQHHDGEFSTWSDQSIKSWKKTGRHFDLEEMIGNLEDIEFSQHKTHPYPLCQP